MSRLEELDQRYQASQTLAEEDQITSQLREYASQDEAEFVRQFRAIPMSGDSPAIWIYEALGEQPERWGDFLLEEFDRIIEAMSTSPNPEELQPLLGSFYLFSLDDEDPLREPLKKRIRQGLSHPHASVRRGCVALIVDFIGPRDMAELMALAQMAQSDDEWQVRYMAFRALEEVWPGKAKKIKLPLWIRTKGRLANLETAL